MLIGQWLLYTGVKYFELSPLWTGTNSVLGLGNLLLCFPSTIVPQSFFLCLWWILVTLLKVIMLSCPKAVTRSQFFLVFLNHVKEIQCMTSLTKTHLLSLICFPHALQLFGYISLPSFPLWCLHFALAISLFFGPSIFPPNSASHTLYVWERDNS